jgi:hypothetical protein
MCDKYEVTVEGLYLVTNLFSKIKPDYWNNHHRGYFNLYIYQVTVRGDKYRVSSPQRTDGTTAYTQPPA